MFCNHEKLATESFDFKNDNSETVYMIGNAKLLKTNKV